MSRYCYDLLIPNPPPKKKKRNLKVSRAKDQEAKEANVFLRSNSNYDYIHFPTRLYVTLKRFRLLAATMILCPTTKLVTLSEVSKIHIV